EQMGGMQSQMPTFMIGFHKVDDESDYTAYIARLRQVPRPFGQLMDHVRDSAEQGIRPPRLAPEGVTEQGAKVNTAAPFTADAARATELKAEARAALVEAVKPAYDEVLAWFKADLPNALVNPSGVGTTHPNGKAYYAQRLAASTTTNLTPDQVHQIGLDEVTRIRGEMEALKDRVGFKGDLKAFFQFIRTDPQFKYPDTDAGRQAYIDDATAAIDTIKKQLPNCFGLLPKADLVVKRVEPFREVAGAAQHYYPST